MRGFTRRELLGVLAIFLAVGALAYFNFTQAEVKSRDEQRKANSRSIVSALEAYHKDFGAFPPSKDGKIIACRDSASVRACEWGRDGLRDLRDSSYPAYIDPIPIDPAEGQGHSVRYISSGSEFQLFISLERRVDAEWSRYVESLDLICGASKCNYGIGLSRRPVTELLEEK